LMSFSRSIQWYHSHTDPIWPDGTLNAPKAQQTALKWESFPDESFKFKWSSRYGRTTYALDIHESRPHLFRTSNFFKS
jgi:hypothetical protein